MSKIAVVYWSGTGNTETMANIVADSAKKAGAEVEIIAASDFTPEQIDNFDALAFGCPSMGSEQLEETEFEPMFQACENELAGKNIGLFGSYGWGSGEWMQNWEDMVASFNAILVTDSVICNLEPDEIAKVNCQKLGAALAKA